jgi:acetyl esterase/lipase
MKWSVTTRLAWFTWLVATGVHAGVIAYWEDSSNQPTWADTNVVRATSFKSGVIDDSTFGSTDGTFGSLSSPAAETAVSGMKAQFDDSLSIRFENLSGSNMTLNTLHFDFARAFSASPKTVSVVYDNGNLAHALDDVIFSHTTSGGAIGKAADYEDLDVNLASVMDDVVLADGQFAVFTFTFSDATGTGAAGIDNIAMDATLAQAVDPLQPVVWLDASEGVGLDNGVAVWTNRAAQGTFNAVQVNTAQRPALLYETWPGHRVIHFDGVDDFLALENTASNLQVEGEFTVFTVGRTTGGDFSAYGGFLGTFRTGAGYKSGWTLRTKSDGTYGFIVGNSNWNQVDGGTGLLGDDFVMLNARYLDDGDGTGTMELFSSLLEEPESKSVNPYALGNSGRDIVIGMFNEPNTDLLNGAMECDIAEIRIYDRALSDEERQAVWDELSLKYEIAITPALLVEDFQPAGWQVPVGTPVEITFSEPMDAGSVTNIIICTGGLDGLPESGSHRRVEGQWAASVSNTVFTFTPDSPFAPGDLVMAEIPTNVLSESGTEYRTVSRETFSFLIDNGVSYAVTTNLIDPMAVVLHDNDDPHDLPLELFIPDTPEPSPVMFWVHGGGWSGGDSGTWERSDLKKATMAYYLAEKLGVAVANVTWRSLDNSDGTFTKATNDIELAIQYVMDHAATLGIDTSRMGLYGGSAGTPTSALVAQANTNISCYIGFNGLYDFVNRVPPYGFGGGTGFEQDDPSLAANSAALNVRTDPPDTLLLHGSADTTIEHQQSQQFASAIQAAGGEADALIYRDEVHAFFNDGRPMHLPILHAASRHLMKVFGLSYGLWAQTHSLSGGPLDNDDGDQLNNLVEYALGGNPTNPADVGIVPEFGIISDGGSASCIYRRRTAEDSGVSYPLELTDNLVSNDWKTTGFTETGAGDIDGIFESVTNEISTLGKTNEFIRLRIVGE